MDMVPVYSMEALETAPATEPAPSTEAPSKEVAAPIPETAGTEVPDNKPSEETTMEGTAADTKQTKETTQEVDEQEEDEYMEDDEEEELLPEDDEWISDEEPYSRKRSRKSHMSESEEEDDEEYGRAKKRKIVPIKKPARKNLTANEPAGMKALRDYTSALKLGPRCFRNLTKISNVKEREMELIRRLHENGRQWEGEYPTPKEIEDAKEETRAKKAEKARQYIIEEEVTGLRTSRKAAQKARDFVKTLGEEESEEDMKDEEIDAESVEDESKDEE